MFESMYMLLKKGYELLLSVHDNLVAETDEGNEEALKEVNKIMIQGMRKVISTTKVGVEGRLTPHLGKKADGVIENNMSSDDLLSM